MDPDSVEDVTNYAIKRAGVAAVALTDTNPGVNDADASLSDDGKTLTITLDNALITSHWGSIVEGDNFTFSYKKLKANNGKEIDAAALAVKYSDKVAPEFVSASASGKTFTNSVTLTFNEPVDTSVATSTINGSLVTMSAGSTPNKVVLTSGTNLVVGTTYNITILNVKDAAGNLMATNPVNTTVTVAGDTVAPTVSKVEVVRDNLLKVTFDKAMNPSTVTNSSIRLVDANLGTTGLVQGTVTAVAGSGNKAFYVPLTAVPFNTTTGTFTGTVVVSNTITDGAGNALTAFTQSVTLTKDAVAPQVASVTYKNTTTYNGISTPNGSIVVKFNESVTESAAHGTYSVVDNKGAVVSTPLSARAINPNDSTELVLSLTAAVGSGITSYTVVMPSSAVVDKSVSANASAAQNLTVDVTAGAPVASDVTAPTVALGTVTAASGPATGSTIVVDYTEAGSGLDAATVINTNNYRLDGLPLPAGSYITLAANAATIHIPAGTIAKDKNYTLNVYNIKDRAGNTALPFISTAVALKDDIKPELTGAALNTNGTLSLTFSETMVTGVSKETAFAVTLNGSLLTGASRAYSIADGVGSDAGKYVFTVATLVDESAGAGGTDTLYIDVNGNGTFEAGTDIVVASVADSTATPNNNYTAGTFNLNNAASLTVGTTGTPTGVTDASNLTNLVKANTTKIVK